MSDYVGYPVFPNLPYERILEIARTPAPVEVKTTEAVRAQLMLKEQCRLKRESLPELAPCEMSVERKKSLLSRMTQALFQY